MQVGGVVITVFEIYQNVTIRCQVDVFSPFKSLNSNSRPAVIKTWLLDMKS
jgi:hypothetical protein